jgi:hypothetical protein
MALDLHNNSRVSTRKRPCDQDAKELLQWKFNKVEFQSRSKESPVISIPANLFASNRALHTTHRRLMEFLTETQEAREGGAAELHKVDNRVLGTIGTSFVTSKIGHLRRDSWVKVNGTELLSDHSPAESRLRADTPGCNITVLRKLVMHSLASIA